MAENITTLNGDKALELFDDKYVRSIIDLIYEEGPLNSEKIIEKITPAYPELKPKDIHKYLKSLKEESLLTYEGEGFSTTKYALMMKRVYKEKQKSPPKEQLKLPQGKLVQRGTYWELICP